MLPSERTPRIRFSDCRILTDSDPCLATIHAARVQGHRATASFNALVRLQADVGGKIQGTERQAATLLEEAAVIRMFDLASDVMNPLSVLGHQWGS